ncbi:MAG: metallophosphoesterase [Gallionella sp.]|nr:metallophosphoesterase [Gallionella sp.]
MNIENVASARTLVIGDIHGCFDELLALIGAAGEPERIVCVGDLVDRGPHPWEVVDFFRSKPDSRQSVCGNHEWKHLMHAGRPDMPSRAGEQTRRAMGALRYAEAIDYFRSLPLWLELPEAWVVHAGLDPVLPPDKTDPKLIMGVNSRSRTGFDGLSPWWFDDARLDISKPVVFGHHVFPEVARGMRGNVWGINTGAGYGAALTGLLLPEFRMVSVPTADHAGNIPSRWASEGELLKIRQFSWNKIFQFLEEPDALPMPVLALMEEARDDFNALIAHLSRESNDLRADYRVDGLSPQNKGLLFKSLASKADFQTSYGRCLIKVMQGHGAFDGARKFFPTPASLREAFSEGRLRAVSCCT